MREKLHEVIDKFMTALHLPEITNKTKLNISGEDFSMWINISPGSGTCNKKDLITKSGISYERMVMKC